MLNNAPREIVNTKAARCANRTSGPSLRTLSPFGTNPVYIYGARETLPFRPSASPFQMFTLFLASLFKVALPFLLIVALIDCLTMSRPRRVRMLRRRGMTFKTISARFNVSPSTVRRWSLA